MPAADRWAPWIEPAYDFGLSNLVVSGVSPVSFGGTLSFTPHIATRIFYALYLDVEETTAGTDQLEVDILLNAAIVSRVFTASPNVKARDGLGRTKTADLLALTTYTWGAQAELSTATGTAWTIHGAQLSLVAMPNLTPP